MRQLPLLADWFVYPGDIGLADTQVIHDGLESIVVGDADGMHALLAEMGKRWRIGCPDGSAHPRSGSIGPGRGAWHRAGGSIGPVQTAGPAGGGKRWRMRSRS